MMGNLKIIVALFILLLVVIFGGKFALDYMAGKASIPFVGSSSKATINGHTFKLYLAKTDKEKAEGLSVRKSMPQDYGMLFTFETADYYTFWMKNMKFPIDILFIKGNKVVTVFSNVPAPKSSDESLLLYKPDEVADKVLELNAGVSNKYNIKKGDTVDIKL